MKYLVNKLQLL